MVLARKGVELVITTRTAETLERTAEDIRRATGVRVTPVAGDITTDQGRAAALACPERPSISLKIPGLRGETTA
jgi:3-oxoacyl-[acyl-carrier protein] reductase